MYLETHSQLKISFKYMLLLTNQIYVAVDYNFFPILFKLKVGLFSFFVFVCWEKTKPDLASLEQAGFKVRDT